MKTIKVFTICLITFVSITSCINTNTLKNDNIDKSIPFKDSLSEKQIDKTNYYISLPKEYIIEEKDGVDFSVYYFSPKDTSVKATFRGGMYFGNFPGEFEPESDSCKISYIRSKILEENLKWTIYNCNNTYKVQTITDSKSGESWNEKIHAFGNANSEADMKKLLFIFSTLNQKKKLK